MANRNEPGSGNPCDIQAVIAGQIGALADAWPRSGLPQIVRDIDDIRCLARDHGFAVVEMLASRLESAVAAGGYQAALWTYLDAMRDAADAPRGPLSAAMHEAWLASVANRLGH